MVPVCPIVILRLVSYISILDFTPCILYPTLNLLPVSYIQPWLYSLYPISNPDSTPCILYQTLILLPVSCIQTWFYSLYPISNLDFTPWILYPTLVYLPNSYIQPWFISLIPISNLGLAPCILGPLLGRATTSISSYKESVGKNGLSPLTSHRYRPGLKIIKLSFISIYILCLSICLFVYFSVRLYPRNVKTSKRLNRLGPNFVWDLT